MMWPNKTPPDVLFIDKQYNLYKPPDVFASFEKLPFRADVFNVVYFDPPHIIGTPPPWFSRADMSNKKGDRGVWYGFYKTKRQAIKSIYTAFKEIARVSSRVCFKWHDGSMKFHKMGGLWPGWRIIQQLVMKPRKGKNTHRRHTGSTWTTMIKDEV